MRYINGQPIMYYRRDGTPIIGENAVFDFGKIMKEDRRIARTEFKDGTWISTVFLSLDYSFDDGGPLIFETMVFSNNEEADQDMNRYSTEEKAIKGHKAMVEKWLKKLYIKSEILK